MSEPDRLMRSDVSAVEAVLSRPSGPRSPAPHSTWSTRPRAT